MSTRRSARGRRRVRLDLTPLEAETLAETLSTRWEENRRQRRPAREIAALVRVESKLRRSREHVREAQSTPAASQSFDPYDDASRAQIDAEGV